MERACEPVAWVFPLPQPELANPSEASQGPVKTRIALGSKQRHQTLGHDIEKAGNAESVDGQEDGTVGDQPVCDLEG